MTLTRTSFLLLAAACAGAPADSDTDTVLPDDATLAADLWTAIADYEDWGRPDGWEDTPAESGDHMGAFIVRFDNDILLSWDGQNEAPENAISVKEQYSDLDGTTLTALTVMQKVPGYDPEHGDWFWAMYDADGMVAEAGRVEMCSGCHSAAPTDYVHTVPPAATP